MLLLALAALLPGLLLPTVEAVTALRPAAWFDQAPAELLAHVAACRDIGAAGARMVGCKVQLGSQPQECVYVPTKAPEPAKALAFLVSSWRTVSRVSHCHTRHVYSMRTYS